MGHYFARMGHYFVLMGHEMGHHFFGPSNEESGKVKRLRLIFRSFG
jgi:hypothetical protein